ncbi:MAG: cellulase family glycosylhydrolase [Prolixibacteraceae bacterium]|nr:cellulase family glycosylhydrolase [Prolixibacteraceae bacterium]
MTITCQSKKKDDPIPQVNISGILKVSADGIFMRDGKAYRGIGVNYFNAFTRTIANSTDKSYGAGLKYLGENKIPFIRFSANGFWPNELKLYQTNKARYFMLLDEFVKSAETNGVGLIPSLFWFYAAVPDLMGEHMNQWGNPNSKTIEFMRTYTSEMVQRYKNSPAIWAWEFTNEVNLYLGFTGQKNPPLPKVSPSSGTPVQRTTEDVINTEIYTYALNEFVSTVRKYDPDRAIFSGNAMASSDMYHRYKYQNTVPDSSTDFTALLDVQNPFSVGTLTIHPYPDIEFRFFSDFKASFSQIIQEAMRSSKELKRPLFIGEFGASKMLGTETETQKFYQSLNAIIDNKVQLAALWVFDFSYQDADWNVTPTNSRKYQLDEIIKANAQFKVGSGL